MSQPTTRSQTPARLAHFYSPCLGFVTYNIPFGSKDPRILRFEFQEVSTSYDLAITIVSPELFQNKAFDAAELQLKLGELLDIPADCLPHLKFDLAHAAVGKDKTVITYGKVFDARYANPLTTELMPPAVTQKTESQLPPVAPQPKRETSNQYIPLIPNEKREWFSPLPFCIFKGRLLIAVSTIDWKGGHVPMRTEHEL